MLTPSLSRAGGGVFEAVAAQAHLVRAIGHEPVLFGLAEAHSEADRHRLPDCELHYRPARGPAAIGYAPGLADALTRARLDLLHLSAIWMNPSQAAARWARRTGRPLAISPHGMLDPWIVGRSRWKKALAYHGWERGAWRTARAFHALTADEAHDIADHLGHAGSRAQVVTVPNAAPPAGRPRGSAGRRFVYLGRIHEKKNLGALVEGFVAAFPEGDGHELAIAGWGDAAEVAALEARIAALGRSDIALLGPVFGEAKAALLGTARFVCLPSHSEGLPMTILEAWAAGTPTLQSRACHLPEGYAEGAALDCGTTPQSVAAAFGQAARATEDDWRTMSRAALRLAEGRFSAAEVAAAWQRFYEGLARGKPA